MDRPRAPASSVVVGKLASPPVGPGTVLAEKYRVERELGRGGFGVVVRAIHLALGQPVAIKILTAGEGGDAEWREDAARFRREAKATAALRSEHVVRILDVDVLETGAPYMVMEYLEGETLHAVLHAAGPLAVSEAVDHVLQILAGLSEAHAAGIVHRDLKPANCFVTRGAGGVPVVKVLDFGVSKVAAGTITASNGAAPATKTGAVIGTVAYMAPEQMLDAKRVDARADLWSVAVILYELLAKKLPFDDANAPTLVASILTRAPAPLTAARADVPPALEAAIMRGLQKAPEGRYPSASAFAAAVAEHASPRARGVLESLRRAALPRGAAAAAEKARPRLPEVTSRPASVAKVVAIVAGGVTVALLGMSLALVLTAPPRPAPRARDAEPARPAASFVDGGAAPSRARAP